MLLTREGVTYQQLVDRLRLIGVDTSVDAITGRIHRGTISLAFVLQIASALQVERLELGPHLRSGPENP